jgi:hypothetical protein
LHLGGAFDADTRGLCRAGGLCAMVLGLSYLAITALYLPGGGPPTEAEDWLKHLSGRTAAWWAILGLSVLTDFLFVPVAVALYAALKQVNKNAILAGAGLLLSFVGLDLTVTWPNYSSLIALGGRYAAATDDARRAMLVASAAHPAAVVTSTLFAVYAILVPSVGILVTGLVMLRGPFGRATALSGVASGLLGILAVVGPFVAPGLGFAAVIASVFTTVWVLLVGYRLYGLGRTAPSPAGIPDGSSR